MLYSFSTLLVTDFPNRKHSRNHSITMVDTRSPQEDDSKTNKRSGDKLSSPIAKRGKTSGETPKKGQQTIEESLKVDKEEDDGVEKSNESKDTAAESKDHEDLTKREEALKKREEALEKREKDAKQAGANGDNQKDEASKDDKKQEDDKQKTDKQEKNAFDEVKADEDEVKHDAKKEQDEKAANINKNNESIVEDDARKESIPSTILEKGIIYFFFRGRVGVDEPQGLQDVARSYLVLRPLPLGAKIGSGPLEDSGNSRLIALPKKMLPKSTKDRFLSFVEKVPTSIKDLREQFAGNDYATQTVGYVLNVV